MYKLICSFFVWTVILLSGCTNDEDALSNKEFFEEFNIYIKELNEAFSYEVIALEMYNGVMNEQTEVHEKAAKIMNEVNPAYKDYTLQIGDITLVHAIKSEEIKDLHRLLVGTSNDQYDALWKLVEGFDSQEEAMIEEAYQLMARHKEDSLKFVADLNALVKEYGISYELETAIYLVED